MLGLILLFPLIGFLINGLWYAVLQAPQGRKKAGSLATGLVASSAIFLSFAVGVVAFVQLAGMPEGARVIENNLFSWIKVGGLSLDFVLRVDPLSSLFVLVIAGIGTLIHVYSIGYMSHDETPGRFFAYLNLFCFSMLVLVLGGALPLLFLGWEGVGLCSYLLIGYWYQDIEKAKAGKKAFIANRVGDLGFLLGMFLIYTTFGTMDFSALREVVVQRFGGMAPAGAELAAVTGICLLLFVGCTGKSAQIPLYVWLPDAMAGPTPVSALIHAATMVTSGIYLVARLDFLYALSPTALEVMAWVGGLTAFVAATIAVVQTDIKRVLAYSTVSQLGYMFLACGVGATGAGVFHVITHAFFKALLFLGAGSVIHGMHEEQDILKMGGLKKHMPRTFLVVTVAWLAICGLPPFSGFFSKDEILWMAFASNQGNRVLWALGLLTAMMTAFYMTRMWIHTFMGSERFDHHKVHPHESPIVMVAPLYVLAVLSAAGGFMGVPHASWLAHWLEPIVPHVVPAEGVNHSMEWVLMAVSVAVALLGMFAAHRLFRDLRRPEALKARWAFIHKVLWNKWFVDELYEGALIRPIGRVSQALWRGFDVAVIDRIVLGFGRASEWSGQTLRLAQTGSLQAYAVFLLLGLVLTLGYMIYGLV
ncbi:MAG: NADH-quinone oxidoreductase subunit L [Bdellovibrionales bacterium]|nr:NADH-quinone oxidoreductase subunit L [Bdellovibrionales bacterium]